MNDLVVYLIYLFLDALILAWALWLYLTTQKMLREMEVFHEELVKKNAELDQAYAKGKALLAQIREHLR